MNEVSFIGFIVPSPKPRTANGNDGEYNEAIWMMHTTPQFNLFLLTIFVHRNEMIFYILCTIDDSSMDFFWEKPETISIELW